MLEELRYRVRGVIWMVSVAAKAARQRGESWTAELERRGRAKLTERAPARQPRTMAANEKGPASVRGMRPI